MTRGVTRPIQRTMKPVQMRAELETVLTTMYDHTIPLDKIVPGDVLDYPFGIDRTPCEALLVEICHTYPDGSMSIRWRPADNPRAVDWRGFIPADDIPTVLRHVADFYPGKRSLLPT